MVVPVRENYTVDNPQQVRSGGPLSMDAWQRPKSINDYSIIHGLFSNFIPKSVWKESINGVEQTTFVNCTSDSGLAVISSGATLNDEVVLDTFRSPRYEPNRGHLWSISALLPNPTAAGQRDFGMFTEENGVFFRLKSDGKLYACRRTTDNGGPTTTTTEELIDERLIPRSVDYTKGNIYDIQMQWRGVGNIKFFIGDPDKGYSVLVHTMEILGTLDILSISNPSLPIAFQSTNLGDEVEIRAGCVDITTEGGQDLNHEYGSISIDNESGSVSGSGFNVPFLVVRNKKVLDGLRNVRDVQALALYAYSGSRSFVRVWKTRDETAITLNDQVWRDYGDGLLEFVQYDNPGPGDPAVTTPMSFDTSKADLVFGANIATDTTFYTPAQFEGRTEVHQSPGDIFIFTLHRDTGSSQAGGVTYEFGLEI